MKFCLKYLLICFNLVKRLYKYLTLMVSSPPLPITSHFDTPDCPPLHRFNPKKDFLFSKVRFGFLVAIIFVLVDLHKNEG